jgi:hypothetical protein
MDRNFWNHEQNKSFFLSVVPVQFFLSVGHSHMKQTKTEDIIIPERRNQKEDKDPEQAKT